MDRQLLFKHYWWVALALGGALSVAAYVLGGDERAGLVGAAIAGTLGFCYFVQQQRLAETELFHELFTAFNARYNQMNEGLARIADRAESLVGLPTEDRDRIVDYFNLCAEEYLFFREGYIHREVWRSWCRGMSWYLKRHPFKDVWNEEVQTESFYGLSMDVINNGAK